MKRFNLFIIPKFLFKSNFYNPSKGKFNLNFTLNQYNYEEVRFKHFSLLTLVMFVINVSAQVPQGFNYQAVARNSVGVLLQNQQLGVKLSIHQGSASGTVVYSERHTPTTNQFGLETTPFGLSSIFESFLFFQVPPEFSIK